MCTEVSTDITGVSTESTSVKGSTCPYISTKGMSVPKITITDVSTVNTVVQGRTNMYEEYGGYKLKRYIGKDAAGKVRKGISYGDVL